MAPSNKRKLPSPRRAYQEGFRERNQGVPASLRQRYGSQEDRNTVEGDERESLHIQGRVDAYISDAGVDYYNPPRRRRGQKTMPGQMNRQQPQAPTHQEREYAPEDQQEYAPEEGVSGVGVEEQEMSDEPFSAQVIRRMHQDALILLEEYDEMDGPLEHQPTKDLLREELETLVEKIDKIESHFTQHHGDLPDLEGGMGQAAQPGEEDGSQTVNPEPSVESDSSPGEEESVDGDEAARAMMTKSFYERTKSLRFRVKGLTTTAEEVKSALALYRDQKGLCPSCGGTVGGGSGRPCSCGAKEEVVPPHKKGVGAKDLDGAGEMGGEEGEEKALEPGHLDRVKDAHDVLGELKETGSDRFGEEHRQKAFWAHKNLESIIGPDEDYPDIPGYEEFQPGRPGTTMTEEEFAGADGAHPGDEELTRHLPGRVETDHQFAGADGNRPGYEEFQGKPGHRESEEELARRGGKAHPRGKKEDKEDDIHTLRNKKGYGGHFHRAKVGRAKRFLGKAAKALDWGLAHQRESQGHQESLLGVLQDHHYFPEVEEEDREAGVQAGGPVEPGGSGEKALRKISEEALNQSKAIKDLLKRLGG